MSTPYFYLIKHINTGTLYAGSKYGKDANSLTFMTEFGYKTSSPIIHRIIEQEGLDAFEILEIILFSDGAAAYQYETLYLKENNARTNPLYYNKHENEFNLTYDSEEFKQMMMDKYGKENAFGVPEIQRIIKEKLMERYGVDHPSKSAEILEKKKRNFKKKYGVENPQQMESIKDKTKTTNIEKYGVDNVFKSEEIKEIIKNKLLKNHGVENPSQSDIVKERKKQRLCRIMAWKIIDSPQPEEKERQTEIIPRQTEKSLHN